MQKYFSLLIGALITLSFFTANYSVADENTIEKAESEVADVKDRPEWTAAVKEKYALTDEQVKSMQDKGITGPQMTMVAGLAKSSGKSIDEIIKMRSEQKMGWGKIAKELGVQPGEIGRAVSETRREMRKENRQEHREERLERRQKHLENRQKHLEKKQERIQKRIERNKNSDK